MDNAKIKRHMQKRFDEAAEIYPEHVAARLAYAWGAQWWFEGERPDVHCMLRDMLNEIWADTKPKE